MQHPRKDDFIDIHVHDGVTGPGIFLLESLMAHENKVPEDVPGVSFTYGIHPWFLNDSNYNEQIAAVEKTISNPDIIAVGEAGFDRLRGPSTELQQRAFMEQAAIAETNRKPVVIHCVRAWDELLPMYKKLRPKMPWLIHGFRGNIELADQLLSKGMYLSFWFGFIIRPESSILLRSLPEDRIFFETDGAEIAISSIYRKVADDLGKDVDELKSEIFNNYNNFFNTGK
jgi:TatD DNase family protein